MKETIYWGAFVGYIVMLFLALRITDNIEIGRGKRLAIFFCVCGAYVMGLIRGFFK